MRPVSACALWRPTLNRAINATKTPRNKIGIRMDGLSLPKSAPTHYRLEARASSQRDTSDVNSEGLQNLEAAHEHALSVHRHGSGHVLERWFLHHRLHCPIAVFP